MLRIAFGLAFTLVFLVSLRVVGQEARKSYALLLKTLYKNTVPVISPEKLAQQVAAGVPPVLLDIRSAKEFRVSHLKDAVGLSYDHFSEADVMHLSRDREIVVYCSVGYRSERIGEKLQQLGFTKVYNLYGGIFEWVNQGHPVFAGDQKTNQVHAYSREWAIWLKKGEKVLD
jgi:rhodanese-related sulfurtransferase